MCESALAQSVISIVVSMVTPHSVPGLEVESAEGNLLSGEDGEECSALSDSLSRLRSPSVMEVREKGYERLKEELAKAQRVGPSTVCPSVLVRM